jgi:predicted ATP-grasp superfamily ATP-dependent carboligase
MGRSPAVVLGMGANGLGYVRSLGAHGIGTIALDVWGDPGMRSRYCIPLVVPHPERDTDGLIGVLHELAGAFSERPPLLPTGDDFLLFTAQHQAELQDDYRMNVPSYEGALLCVNKRLQYERAERVGIAIPHTVYPSDSDIETVTSDVTFPCFLKPYYGHRWREHLHARRESVTKMVEVSSRRELEDAYHAMRGSGLDFLVQEKIPGEDDRLWALQTYIDATGSPKAIFTKRKLRQFPRGIGDSSCQVGERNDEVASLGLSLLASIQHRGCAGVEFKEDPRDGRLKLIEVNPRSLATNHHAVVSGVDIPFIHYRDVCQDQVRMEDSFEEGIKWIHLARDLPAFLEYWAMGDLDVAGWIASWRGRRCYAYFEWDDPLPACAEFGGSFTFLLRTILRSRAKRHAHATDPRSVSANDG